MITPAFLLKKKQYLLAALVGTLGLGIMGLLIWSVDNDAFDDEPFQTPIKETQITTAGQRVNPQEVWVERMESENKLTQNKLDTLEKLLMSNIKNSGESESRLQQKLHEIEQRKLEPQTAASLSNPMHHPMGQILPMQPSEHHAPPPHPATGVRKIVLNLSNNPANNLVAHKATQDKTTLENTLPAGTFAKAVLLGGVDASTAVAAQADPRPVLLRIADEGNLPRQFKSDLKACHVLASCYGDISSERVYMRLEKLTCTERLTGEISETQVAGYVVGEDGRAGVRGVVADRAGPMIRNSLMGGFLSGMGSFFSAQQQKSVFPISPFGQTNALSVQQMLSSGASEGTSQALDKYAEFFIKRAEQLQPVLQVAAGRQVDIVFTQGTRFGETSVRKSLTKIRTQSRQHAIQKLEGSADSQSWLPQPTGDE
jgi:conjugal transfer pilus assembly protein TraB